MRPPKIRQNQLRRPLNQMLGTEASVRILRELALSVTPLTAGEVARRTELGRTSVYPVLRELEAAEVVEFVGAGAQRQVQLRMRHPLAEPLSALFRSERDNYDDLIASLRNIVADAPVAPISVWIEHRHMGERAGDTLTIQFASKPAEIESFEDYLGSHLTKVERRFDVAVHVKGVGRSEVEAAYAERADDLNDVVLIGGVPPAALIPRARSGVQRSGGRTHESHDEQAKKLALAVAIKIRRDPGLVREAMDRVARRMRKASAGERRELTEWTRVLNTMSPARLRRFLTEDSERASRLRQTLPALCLLTASERAAVMRSETDAEVKAAVSGR